MEYSIFQIEPVFVMEWGTALYRANRFNRKYMLTVQYKKNGSACFEGKVAIIFVIGPLPPSGNEFKI